MENCLFSNAVRLLIFLLPSRSALPPLRSHQEMRSHHSMQVGLGVLVSVFFSYCPPGAPALASLFMQTTTIAPLRRRTPLPLAGMAHLAAPASHLYGGTVCSPGKRTALSSFRVHGALSPISALGVNQEGGGRGGERGLSGRRVGEEPLRHVTHTHPGPARPRPSRRPCGPEAGELRERSGVLAGCLGQSGAGWRGCLCCNTP
ncbi:uncharacterized protein LOC132401732 [Hypanus sabinus]|uniref:uncharacterized protein LOC132401732 n=1 Tax=Hypanus sabinus TaxID=79690 RepID=UPI0028C4C5BF|nr:uncharacterized protein LOC132401732 [Hypanus sabinus]